MQRRFFLDVVVRQCTSILQLFPCNTIIKLLLSIEQKRILGISSDFSRAIPAKINRCWSGGMPKNQHDKDTKRLMTQWQFIHLQSIVLSTEYKAIYTFLVLDLGLNILNSIRSFDFQSDGLASQCLYEDLHP